MRTTFPQVRRVGMSRGRISHQPHRQHLRMVRAIHGPEGCGWKWDEAPNFPGLTNAYFQAIETAKNGLLKPFTD